MRGQHCDLCVCVLPLQIMIMEVKSIICAGYSAVLHIHSAVEEVHIKVCVSVVCVTSWSQNVKRLCALTPVVFCR